MTNEKIMLICAYKVTFKLGLLKLKIDEQVAVGFEIRTSASRKIKASI